MSGFLGVLTESNNMKIFLSIVVVLLFFGLILSPSEKQLSEKFDLDAAECSQIAAKTALSVPGRISHDHEIIGHLAAKKCMTSRGWGK